MDIEIEKKFHYNFFYILNKKSIIFNLCIFLIISWSIFYELYKFDVSNIMYNMLYILLFYQLIKKKRIDKEKKNIYKLLCCLFFSLFVTIISLCLINTININPYSYFYKTNKYILLLFFLDYFLSYSILFLSFCVYYIEIKKCILLINNIQNLDLTNNARKFLNEYSNSIEEINNKIANINGIYIVYKLWGLICICVTAINIYKNKYNYINFFDVCLIIIVELMYYFMYNKINYTRNIIINYSLSTEIINKINNEILFDDYLLLTTILKNKKINVFSFLNTDISEYSIIQQVITTIFGWILAEKILNILSL